MLTFYATSFYDFFTIFAYIQVSAPLQVNVKFFLVNTIWKDNLSIADLS